MKNAQDIWDYESEEQKRKMEEKITGDNCGEKIKLVREIAGISRRELAKIIGSSESTITRIERQTTKPTEDFKNRLRAIALIGHHRYSKMSESEKSSTAETLGGVGGVATGVGASVAAISASGSVAGLSAAGVTSGLSAIGIGGMIGGIATVAVIPAAIGLGGYGLVKGIKAICESNKLDCKEIDGNFEIVPSRASKEEK